VRAEKVRRSRVAPEEAFPDALTAERYLEPYDWR